MVAKVQSQTSFGSIRVSRQLAVYQIEMRKFPRNSLSAFLKTTQGGQALQNRSALPPQEQSILDLALPLLASPALVVQSRVVLDDGAYYSNWILIGAGSDSAKTPILFMAHDEAQDILELHPLVNRDTAARSLLQYLDLGLPTQPGKGFEMPTTDFMVLMTLCDLYRRGKYSSKLDHIPIQPITFHDVELGLADSREHPDPRWLLPLLIANRPPGALEIDLRKILQTMAGRGWVVINADTLYLGEPGMSLAAALDQRLAVLSFWAVGMNPTGEVGSRSLQFIRTPWQIWFFDIGGDDGLTTRAFPVDVAAAYSLLQDLMAPVGSAQPLPPAAPVLIQQKVENQNQPVVDRPPLDQTMVISQPLRCHLVVLEGSFKRREFDMDKELTLGRSPENTILLEDAMVSRQHARIYWKDSGYVIEDLGTPNGTFVNGRRISQSETLQVGDKLKIGSSQFEISAIG